MKTAVAFFTLIAVLAGLTWYLASQQEAPRQEGNFQVYQSGDALELALDLDSIANVNDGLVRFINQERYAEKKREESLDISYQVRRLEGRADCQNMQSSMCTPRCSRCNATTGPSCRWSRAPLPKPC